MANRQKNPTTKMYNRLFHALNNLNAGRCPIHATKLVPVKGEQLPPEAADRGHTELVRCPECFVRATKKKGQKAVQLTNDCAHVACVVADYVPEVMAKDDKERAYATATVLKKEKTKAMLPTKRSM